jgi:hypothetical protein
MTVVTKKAFARVAQSDQDVVRRAAAETNERMEQQMLALAADTNRIVVVPSTMTCSTPTPGWAMSRSLLKLEWRLLSDHYAACLRGGTLPARSRDP